ncbi:MAG: aminotransferase class I/II-fold pyridoxal phosphate-dependent enzyme [Opitutales bacterium]|nr:aminotransferase class I/II-fold pyridoxal phosphate-dependent enzyme [Opitutales bacterium]
MKATRPPRDTFLPFFEPQIGEEEIREVVDTLRSNWITTGPKTRRFEAAFAHYVEAPGALSANSWTAAAHTALLALGVGPGDEVITTPMTFCATANIIEHVGATPVFVDVEPDTLNIDPEGVARAVSAQTKVILPVHYAGHPVDLDPIEALAREHGITIVEDAAHALPARYKGRMIGAGPNLAAFSFYATKNLTTAEGGMLTGDPAFLDRARIFTLHGMSNNAWNRYDRKGTAHYEVVTPGYKYNLTDMQSALGLHQLERLAAFQRRRREIVARYTGAFAEIPELEIPVERADVEHAWHLYVIRLNLEGLTVDRDTFSEALKARNIGTSLHFIPIHLHPYYRDKYGFQPVDFPVAYGNYLRIVSLPLHPGLSDDDVEDVISAVLATVERYRGKARSVPVEAKTDAAPAEEKSAEGRGPGSAGAGASMSGQCFRIYLSPPHITGREPAALAEVVRSHWIAPVGPKLAEFESRVAKRVGVARACGVVSGTAALHLSLRALGVGRGDRVLCPTFSFVAAANPILYLGAEPVFIDSERKTWNMDPDLVAEHLEDSAKSGSLPKAVVVADIYGQCADFDRLRAACEPFGIPILEDAAEALGATYKGRNAGGLGDLAALSFNGNKIITTSGGGMVMSERPEWIKKVYFWASQAKEPGLQYVHAELGYNYRLSNVLAALGLTQLESLDTFVRLKRRIFERYVEGFADIPGISWMPEPEGWMSTRWLTCMVVDASVTGVSAIALCEHLHSLGIESRPLWKPLHEQPLYRDAGHRTTGFARSLAECGLALPSGSNLSGPDQEAVIDAVRKRLPGVR